MIKKIHVKGFGCLKKPVEVDFTFKNYQRSAYDDISPKKQVWNNNGLSVIMALLGKNATGKTTFFAPIKILRDIESERLLNQIIDYVEFYIEDKILYYIDKKNGGEKNSKNILVRNVVTQTHDIFNDESNSIILEIQKEYLSQINESENIIEDIVYDAIKDATSNIIENHSHYFNKNDDAIFSFESEKEKYQFAFTKGDIYSVQENRGKASLIKTILDNLKPKINNLENNFQAVFDLDACEKAIKLFVAPVIENIDMLSVDFRSKISENNRSSADRFMRRRRVGSGDQSISSIINKIVDLTSVEFMNDLLGSIDPMISSVKMINKSSFLRRLERYNNVGIFLKNQKIAISSEMLSSGTKHFLIILHKCLTALEKGKLVMIDELDNGLQIRLAQLLIELFADENINKLGSQILFTTHSINYIGQGVLHQKNHTISFRDKEGNVVFKKYDQILNEAGLTREVTRDNIYKHYFDEHLFKEDPIYPFMITKKERDAIIKGITLELDDED